MSERPVIPHTKHTSWTDEDQRALEQQKKAFMKGGGTVQQIPMGVSAFDAMNAGGTLRQYRDRKDVS